MQMSSVLRHVAKHNPHWRVDFQAEAGRYCVGRGIVDNVFEFGKNPNPDKVYDAEVEILLFDKWGNWYDRPNTHVSQCLHSRFGLKWDRECSGYQVSVRQEVTDEVRRSHTSFVPQLRYSGKRVAAVHYSGDSAPSRKDLSDAQADAVCDHIIELGCVPLLIDWRDISPVANRRNVCTTGRITMSRIWGRDAEYNCAVIRECAAFVGIDSGPAKCASATEVPSLVVWTGHHPAAFYDPSPNTTHLIPHRYDDLLPEQTVEARHWFEANNNVRNYSRDPVAGVKDWLSEVLYD